MDPERYIAEQALRGGKFFAPVNREALEFSGELATCDFLPKQHCGFDCAVRRRRPLSCSTEYDPRAVVSLALLDWQLPFLRLYANKVPLMCLNAGRLQYTLDAFRHGGHRAAALTAGNGHDPVALALGFLVETDIAHVADTPEPNARFSRLLHLLRSCGYEAYVFALARHLDLDVDLAHCRSTRDHRDSPNVVFRYRRTRDDSRDSYIADGRACTVVIPTPSSNATRARRARDSSERQPRNGVITAVHNESRWFVRVTQKYIVSTLD